MAALTWKNVDETRASSADAYNRFSELLTKAGEKFSTGLTDFQNVRKEQAAMAVQRLLEQQTNSKQLNTPNAVETMLQDIPPDLISPAIFEQIANRRRDLQTSELFDANLNKMVIDNKATEASTALSQDALKTNAQNRELGKLNLQSEQFKIDNQARVLDAELANKNASTVSSQADAEATRAGIAQKDKEIGLERSKFDHLISQDKFRNDRLLLDEAEKSKVAKATLDINNTPDYITAKNIIANSGVSDSGKLLLNQTLRDRFPKTAGADNLPAEVLNSVLPPTETALTPLSDLRIKGNDNTTSTFGKLGITSIEDIKAKGGQHFNGGDNNPSIITAARLMQGSLGDLFERATGMNDQWHQKKSPNSEHTKGKAMDFTVTGGALKDYEKAASQARQTFIQQGLVQDKDFTVYDEANHPSSKATKEHIHVELTDSGLNKLNRLEEARKNDIKALPTELTREISKANKNVPTLTSKADQYINATEDTLGLRPVVVGKDQDPNDPTTLAKAITGKYGISNPQNDAMYANLISDTFKQMQSEGNSAVTMNDVASAFMNATTKDVGRWYDFRNWAGGVQDASLNEDKVKETLNFINTTRGIEAKNMLASRKEEASALKTSVEQLNKLNEMLNAELTNNSQGADNGATVQRLREAIKTQVSVVASREDRVRAFIENFQKEDARKAKQALENNPASENYQY